MKVCPLFRGLNAKISSLLGVKIFVKVVFEGEMEKIARETASRYTRAAQRYGGGYSRITQNKALQEPFVYIAIQVYGKKINVLQRKI